VPIPRALRFAALALALAVTVTAAPAAAAPVKPAALTATVEVESPETTAGQELPGYDFTLGALGVVASATVQDAAGPVTVTFDWGDGTSTTLDGSPGADSNHGYAQPGSYPVVVTVTDGTSSVVHDTTFTTAGTSYTAVIPTRVLDTRTGTGTTGGPHKVPARSSVPVRVAGVAGVPASGVSAVVLTVTATDPSTAGYVAVSPFNTIYVAASWSNLNFATGQTVADLATVRVDDGSWISVGNGSDGTVDLVVDIAGYYRTAAGDTYTGTAPARLLDTRNGTGYSGAIPARGSLSLPIAGNAGLPASGITAVALNVTATASTTAGYVTVWPGGAARPTASSLNYATGQTVAGLVIVPVGADGTVQLYNGSDGPLHLVADVSGYYTAGGGHHFVPFDPHRALDTRSNGGPITSHGVRWVRNGFVQTAPVDVVNVTAVGPTAAGFLAVFPNDTTIPNTSTLNYGAGQTVANLAQCAIGGFSGDAVQSMEIYNGSNGSTNVIVDLFGWFD
jgi:hypothetical protein